MVLPGLSGTLFNPLFYPQLLSPTSPANTIRASVTSGCLLPPRTLIIRSLQKKPITSALKVWDLILAELAQFSPPPSPPQASPVIPQAITCSVFVYTVSPLPVSRVRARRARLCFCKPLFWWHNIPTAKQGLCK